MPTTRRPPERALRVLLAAALLAGCGGDLQAAEEDDLRAVFSRVRGRVTLTVPARGAVRIARPLQVVPPGAVITVAPEADAELVCSTHRHVLLAAGSEWSLTRDACARGRELSPDTYRLLAPRGGRPHPVGRLIAVARDSRGGGGDPRIPVLLSPRNSAVVEGRPALRWTAVEPAAAYEIEVLGRRDSFGARLEAGEVRCAPDPELWGDVRVCEAPYPADRPELVPGGTYFVSVRTEGSASPLAGEQVHRLSAEKAGAVAAAVSELESGPLSEAARRLAIAGTYAEHDLLGDALRAYRRALDLEPAPEVRVGLADVLLLSGLADFAEVHYRAAREGDDDAVAAAAAFGLGQSLMVRRRYREALEPLRHARAAYERLGLADEAAAAAKQAERAEARLLL